MAHNQRWQERNRLAMNEFAFEDGFELPLYGSGESPFNELEEMELATELLGTASDAEIDYFLGKLFKKAWRGIRKVAGGVLRPLGKALKAVAKKALPVLAGAAGTFFGGPAGGALGASLGSAVSKALELEYEGLNPDDREYEIARRFIRLAGTTARQAATAQPGTNPQTAVRDALLSAVQQQIPGALSPRGTAQAAPAGNPNTGRWVGRGRTIVLQGV